MSDVPNPPPRLVLASSSRYRRELLERLRIPFDVIAPDIDETPLPDEAPETTAVRLSIAKARAAADRAPDAVVIGSDQVATFDGRQIGKPGTHQNAVEQLQAMRGKRVAFHSALSVFDGRSGNVQSADVVTHVQFRNLSDDEIEAYLRAETPYDCAGSAKAEGLGITLLDAIDSNDPTALIGLPLIELSRMLRAAGFALPGAR